MRLPDIGNRKVLGMGAGLGVILPILLGWMTTNLPTANVHARGSDEWTLPAIQSLQRFNDGDFQKIMGSKALAAAESPGGRAGVGNNEVTGASTPSWTLVGTVVRPSPVALILVSGNIEVERVPLGETRDPVGKVLGVASDGITIENSGCVRNIQLFEQSIIKPQAACEAPGTAASGSSRGGEKQ